MENAARTIIYDRARGVGGLVPISIPDARHFT